MGTDDPGIRRFRTALLPLIALTLFAGAPLCAEEFPGGSLYRESFQFRNDRGEAADLTAFRGRNVILTMFYTDCTSTCTLTLSKLREIERAFEEKKIPVELVLVSFDARNDSPRNLARFRKREKLPAARWHLLTGDTASIRRLATRIGLGNFSDLGDHILHAFRIVLLDEQGVIRKSLDWDHRKVESLFEEVTPAANSR